MLPMSFFWSLQAHVYVLPVVEPEVRDSSELGHVLRGVILRGVVSVTSSRARLVSLLVMTLSHLCLDELVLCRIAVMHRQVG